MWKKPLVSDNMDDDPMTLAGKQLEYNRAYRTVLGAIETSGIRKKVKLDLNIWTHLSSELEFFDLNTTV